MQRAVPLAEPETELQLTRERYPSPLLTLPLSLALSLSVLFCALLCVDRWPIVWPC